MNAAAADLGAAGLTSGRCAGRILQPIALRGMTLADVASGGAQLGSVAMQTWSNTSEFLFEVQLEDDGAVSDLSDESLNSTVCSGLGISFALYQQGGTGRPKKVSTTVVRLLIDEDDRPDIVLKLEGRETIGPVDRTISTSGPGSYFPQLENVGFYDEGSTVTGSVRLSTKPSGNVTVRLFAYNSASVVGMAGSVSFVPIPSTLSFDAFNWDEEQQYQVLLKRDGIVRPINPRINLAMVAQIDVSNTTDSLYTSGVLDTWLGIRINEGDKLGVKVTPGFGVVMSPSPGPGGLPE